MKDACCIAACAVLSYLLGAIPFGLLVARARGVNIRKTGSGNIGATNVFRSVGKPWGVLTFVLDAVKGIVPALVFPRLAGAAGVPVAEWLPLLCGSLAVAGHNWPVYLRFKGGKGVATSAGALVGIAPREAGIAFAVWMAVFLLGRYVSVASIAAAGAIAAAGWVLFASGHGSSWLLPCALTLLAAVIIWRHKGNIHRLRAGTEHRFTFKRKS